VYGALIERGWRPEAADRRPPFSSLRVADERRWCGPCFGVTADRGDAD